MKKFKLDGKKLVGTIDKKKIRKGSYSIAITAVVIAIIVVINLVLAEIPSKYMQLDVSEQKLYTISSETEKLLKGLKKDVTLYFVTQTDNKDETVNKLLERYKDSSSHIKVKQIDPVMHPNFTDEYTSEDLTENSVIVVSGDKNKVVEYSSMYETEMSSYGMSSETTGFDGEGQLTSAVSYVTSDNLPILYTLEGHGENSLGSSVESSIKKDNIDIQSLNLLTAGQVPEDADCILINSPMMRGMPS